MGKYHPVRPSHHPDYPKLCIYSVFGISGSQSSVLEACLGQVVAFSLEANLAFSVKTQKTIVGNLNSRQARMP